ncbi:MAG: creatininase family protein [Muribaculaceae bacterium]|nr:creatininase family protein [Muribaculaceae bacterium]MDE7143107.1 creatininase family protein [Muribaculaceae bacterium]
MNDKEFDLAVSNYGTTRSLDYQIAIIPWGATEPHNYHLPYLTDAILSHDIAVDAARVALAKYGVRAMVMPGLPLGAQNPGQRELKFCVHYRYETQKAVLTDIVASLDHQGIRRLLIVNGHGGNSFKNMIRDLGIDFPDMLIAASEWYKVCPATEFFDAPGDHADELETSVMMHYHPELVNLSEAGEGKAGGFAPETLRGGVAWIPRDWSRVSVDTGIGSPAAATAEKGMRFAAAVAETYATLLRDLTLPDLYLPLGD